MYFLIYPYIFSYFLHLIDLDLCFIWWMQFLLWFVGFTKDSTNLFRKYMKKECRNWQNKWKEIRISIWIIFSFYGCLESQLYTSNCLLWKSSAIFVMNLHYLAFSYLELFPNQSVLFWLLLWDFFVLFNLGSLCS